MIRLKDKNHISLIVPNKFNYNLVLFRKILNMNKNSFKIRMKI